jgi:hypothetical protein
MTPVTGQVAVCSFETNNAILRWKRYEAAGFDGAGITGNARGGDRASAEAGDDDDLELDCATP